MRLPLPPPQEQQQIADFLTSIATKIQVEKQRQKALDALFQTLLHYLMTGKVRVGDMPAPTLT